MTDGSEIGQRDRLAAIIEGARSQRGVFDDDPANQYPSEQDSQTFTVGAGPIWADGHVSAPFKIRSVRVDNATNQWLQCGPEFDFIAPFTFGRVFNVRGYGTVELFRSIPPNGGLPTPGIVAGQFFKVTVYDRPQPPATGVNGDVGVVTVRI